MQIKNLVIVESPEKARTIQRFLGDDYVVRASRGHIRDLQEHSLSVDVEHGFIPEYVIPEDKKRVVAELKKLSEQAATIWLASDEDREGEAISWHLQQTLQLPPEKTRRIAFHEITKTAIQEAIQAPRGIDMNMVDAQQARRVLDRLVGFELSPILWRKIQPKLSAGRVQSVALRLIVDREKEIMAFKSEPYYRVEGEFTTVAGAPVKAVLDSRLADEAAAQAFLEKSIGASYRIESVEKKEGTRLPAAPFTTSTLQQEAARKLRFPVSTTMRVAQSLYERGLITYMRTDSTTLSALAIASVKQYILQHFGPRYLHTRQFKTHSKGAQEAHEAIRPTFIANERIEGTLQEQRLYELIRKRTIASQMAESQVCATTLTIASDAHPEKYLSQATELLFDGFMKVYLESRDDEPDSAEENVLPPIRQGDSLGCRQISALCKYTAPPVRYSDASLVHKLEELGIGRPSTYAAIVETLTKGRGYVTRGDKAGESHPVTNLVLKDGKIKTQHRNEVVGAEKGKLLPQEIGLIVTRYLVENFTDILDYEFTARVEADFDEVAEGKKSWNGTIGSFYTPFHRHVEALMADRSYSNRVTRELGLAPDGQMVTASFGKFGAYVQKGDGDSRQSASLAPGQLIETLTLEDALELLRFPRTVGQIDGVDAVIMKGRFGPYLKYGEKNVSLPRKADPLTITLEECTALVKAESARPEPEVIAVFGDIQIINGRYGPYIKKGGNNYKIPRGTNASTLSEADCEKLIAQGPSEKKRGFRRKK
ncbi:MAG: type I DNA topoisomerase [Bacteroidales bacterium]|nr:type I DNA topoisomerase [Bacteroidales bacterium]